MTVRLGDGTAVVVRAVQREDRALLATEFLRLSDESRYRRFLTPKSELTDAELTYLTDVDHHDHEALAAFTADSGHPLGIARFVRLADEPHSAEAAVAVTDDWQHRGVATVLLEALAERGREEGISSFRATFLELNSEPVIGLFEQIGQPHVRRDGAGTAVLDLELAERGLGSSLIAALRAVARGDLSVASSWTGPAVAREVRAGAADLLARAASKGIAPVRALLRHGSGVDWAAEGLLDDLDDEQSITERTTLLEELALSGVDLELLRAAVTEERLAVLPVEQILAGDERWSLTALAARSGLEPAVLASQFSALGHPASDADTICYDDEDLRTAQTLGGLVKAGIDEENLRQLARVLAQSASVSAEAVRELLGDGLLRPGDSERGLGLRYAEVTETLGPEIQWLLGHLLQVHLREQLRRDVVRRAERQAGHTAPTVTVSVAFVDLVDFTGLGEHAPPQRLGQVATRLADLAADLAQAPVRLVKLIGDGAMLASPEPEPLLHAVQALVAAAEQDGLPKLRAGISSGQAVTRRGDLYGSVVNRAARICTKAEPGQVLAEQVVRDAECDGVSWRPIGPHHIKGIREPIPLHELQLSS